MHGVLADADVTALISARRLGYHRLTDMEVLTA
jgi:hypothetical protein